MLKRVELATASTSIIGVLALSIACSSEPGPSSGMGGSTNGGAVGMGGAQSGGATSGGMSSSGGATSGGASSGGATSGGASSGGATSGGAPGSGGASSGGKASGGAAGAAGGGAGGGGNTASGGAAGASGGGAGGAKGGAGGVGGGGAAGASSGGTGGGATGFSLTSPNHAEGAKFASKYTCAEAGFDKSILPELNWTAGPAGTKSYAITFIDTTLAPANMNGYHWVMYNIPATVQKLTEGLRDATSVGAKQNGAFLGPCPNFMSSGALKTDNYEFTLYALAGETVTITGSGTAAVKDAQTKLEASNLGSVKLKGTSDAKWPK